MYEVEFSDGTKKSFATNIFTQKIYSQVNSYNRRDVIVENIIYYCQDPKYAVTKSKQKNYHNGQNARGKQTQAEKIVKVKRSI